MVLRAGFGHNSGMGNASQILVFDRALLRNRRARAAGEFAAHDAVFAATADMLLERLGDVKKDFTSILELGARNGALAKQLRESYAGAFVVACDLSPHLLSNEKNALAADEEFLPFAPASFDLVISNMSLQWINDLPGALAQIKSVLKPGGLFMAALPGGDTLRELRACLLEAELAVTGGASPRLSPSIDMQTASGLLQRAGFSLPVADREIVNLSYPDMPALMRDLRGMGEANAHRGRVKHFTRKAIFTEAARLYRARHVDAAGRVTAHLEAIFLHGWK